MSCRLNPILFSFLVVSLSVVMNAPGIGGELDQEAAPGLDRFLDSHSRFDLETARSHGYEGPIDPSGFDVRFGNGTEEPIFLRDSETGLRNTGDGTWQEGFHLPGVTDEVICMAIYNGELIVGGLFSFAGEVVSFCVVSWDGTNWNPLGEGTNYQVNALTVYDGDLIAGGWFTTAGGVSAERVASWNGASWSPLGAGLADGFVSALYVYDGELIAGGQFTEAGGIAVSNIARWDGANWSGVGTGISGSNSHVLNLSIYAGDLIAGGHFDSAGGVGADDVARWDGTSWHALGDGLSGYAAYCLAVFDGDLIVGGDFYSAGGVGASNIASWNGSAWSTLGSGVDSHVYALTVHNDLLIVGGRFDEAGGGPANRIASWDGMSWNPIGDGMDDKVLALAEFDGDLHAGGEFLEAGGNIVYGISSWNGVSWNTLSTGGNGLSDQVETFVMHEGDLIVAGYFQAAGDTHAKEIARWDGTDWHPMGSGTDNRVKALASYDGGVIAGGSFDNIGGTAARNIARWDGSSWHPLDSGTSGTVYALTVYDGDLIVAGWFSQAGGSSARSIARWDGTNWYPLGAGITGIVPLVRALTTYNGDLIVAGKFTVAGGLDVNNIARWDGSSWYDLGGGVDGSNQHVLSLTVYDGDLVVAGEFTEAGGTPVSNIAGWDGTSWFDLGGGIDGALSALTTTSDNLIAGGHFDTAGGVAVSHIARWDGSSWNTMGSGLSYSVRALIDHPDGLFVGGMFHVAGGKASAHITRWLPTVPPEAPLMNAEPIYTQGTSNTVSWSDESASGAVAYLTQCAQDDLFTVDLQESGWIEGIENAFNDLIDSQIYYYRVKSRTYDLVESEWSEPVFSTQDDSPPVSSVDPLPPEQETLTFDVPYTASDATSGVTAVELFYSMETPGGISTFGWEDGVSTDLGQFGTGNPPILASNDSTFAHTGTHSLKLRDNSPMGTPQSFVAWIRGLTDGDSVRAGFWRYDTTAAGGPSCRIWAKWNDEPDDVTGYDGDAGGNPYYGPGTGWDFVEWTWEVVDGHTGLVIQARTYSNLDDTVWVDDLEVEAPAHASVTFPGAAEVEYESYGVFASSPISFTAPGAGTYGFYTVATDAVGNEELPPESPPDATTTVSLSAVDDNLDWEELLRDGQRLTVLPNPATSAVEIVFAVQTEGAGVVSVHDIGGREVCTLARQDFAVGYYMVTFDRRDGAGRPLAPGVYFVRVQLDDLVETRTITLLR